MQAQFAQDNNPDAQTLQKLADMTGLSRRVIQVGLRGLSLQVRSGPQESAEALVVRMVPGAPGRPSPVWPEIPSRHGLTLFLDY